MRQVPGVAQAAASTITPFNPATKSPLFADPARVHEQVVSPAFFATYGQVIRAGRDFDSRDSAQAPRVVMVSESYVRRFLAGRDPLAVTLESGHLRSPSRDVRDRGRRRRRRPRRATQRPASVDLLSAGAVRHPGSAGAYDDRAEPALRPPGLPALLAPGAADALARFDRRLSFSYRPLDQDVTAALTQERLLAMLSSFFGGLALLLSALGLYGMTAHAAARRRTEIGIRLALGATPMRVLRLVLLRTLTVTGLGMLAGIAASAWASRFIASLLFGVQPGSPVTIAAAGLILMVVAAVASAIPAVQASRSDPASALREA